MPIQSQQLISSQITLNKPLLISVPPVGLSERDGKIYFKEIIKWNTEKNLHIAKLEREILTLKRRLEELKSVNVRIHMYPGDWDCIRARNDDINVLVDGNWIAAVCLSRY